MRLKWLLVLENQLQNSYFKFHIEKSGAIAQENGRGEAKVSLSFRFTSDASQLAPINDKCEICNLKSYEYVVILMRLPCQKHLAMLWVFVYNTGYETDA